MTNSLSATQTLYSSTGADRKSHKGGSKAFTPPLSSSPPTPYHFLFLPPFRPYHLLPFLGASVPLLPAMPAGAHIERRLTCQPFAARINDSPVQSYVRNCTICQCHIDHVSGNLLPASSCCA